MIEDKDITNIEASKVEDSSSLLVQENAIEKVEEHPITISSSKEEIVDRMQKTSSIDELKDLTTLFGISLTKREIIRASKESDLMDKLLEQAEQRIVEKGDCLSHTDLLDYMKTLQTNVDKSRKTFNDDIDNASTKITNTHTEINVNIGDSVAGLSRESRERVLDVMKTLFAQINQEQQEVVEEPQEIEIESEEEIEEDDD